MRIAVTALALALVPVLASCGQNDAPVASAQAHEIAWREGDVDDAGKFGAEGLLQAGADRTSFEEVSSFDGLVGRLVETINSERTAPA